MKTVELAVKIAKEAGTELAKQIDNSFNIEQKKSSFDLVTEWDKNTEHFIKESIKQKYPDHEVIGEESISNESNISLTNKLNNKSNIWVIDPIDGTSNYVHGLPGYTISIALLKKGELSLGVVYDPHNDEMFYAEKSRGAFLNNKKINVSNQADLISSIIATGFPSEVSKHRVPVLNQIKQIGTSCHNIRVYGSAALHCAYVAAGRLEAYWEPGLNIWDIAAGALIVKEAGGKVSEMDGEKFSYEFGSFLCTNGRVDNEMIRHFNSITSK